MPIYNIVINSNNAVGGTNYSNYEYVFDWSSIPESEYEMSFNFTAEGSAVHKVLNVELVGLGCSTNTFVTSNLTNQKTSNVIGVVAPDDKTTDTHYSVSNVYNPPLYLSSKPYSNQFSVIIKDTTGALSNIGVEYVLILSLKKI